MTAGAEEVAVALKFGGLIIRLDSLCGGTCRFNGEPLPISGLTLQMALGEPAKLTLDVEPLSLEDRSPEVIWDGRGRDG